MLHRALSCRFLSFPVVSRRVGSHPVIPSLTVSLRYVAGLLHCYALARVLPGSQSSVLFIRDLLTLLWSFHDGAAPWSVTAYRMTDSVTCVFVYPSFALASLFASLSVLRL